MKKLLQFLALLLLTSFSIQTKAQNTCATPYLFESGNTYTYNLDTGVVNQDTSVYYDCLSTQPNPLWLFFNTCGSGSIDITMNASTGTDVDFIVWGPLSSFDDCNLNNTNVVDCSFSTSTSETINISNLSPGIYKIMITNYANQFDSVQLSQTGGTGTTCDTSVSCNFPTHQICKVTTDHAVNKNVINWEKEVMFNGEYKVQKETTTAGIFSTIGVINSTLPSIFTDTVSNPIQQSYKYRIQSIDTCGDIKTSNFHKTIHLLSSINPTTNYPQLSWTNYIGFNYYTYYIYRGTSSANLSLYDSISSSFNTYVDVNPLSGNLYYAIGVNLPSQCTSSGALKLINEVSYSNVTPVNVVSVDEFSLIGFTLYPNPTKEVLNISFGTETISARFELMDIYGRIISTKNIENTTKFEISVADLPQGYYVVNINSDKGISRKTFVKSN